MSNCHYSYTTRHDVTTLHEVLNLQDYHNVQTSRPLVYQAKPPPLAQQKLGDLNSLAFPNPPPIATSGKVGWLDRLVGQGVVTPLGAILKAVTRDTTKSPGHGGFFSSVTESRRFSRRLKTVTGSKASRFKCNACDPFYFIYVVVTRTCAIFRCGHGITAKFRQTQIASPVTALSIAPMGVTTPCRALKGDGFTADNDSVPLIWSVSIVESRHEILYSKKITYVTVPCRNPSTHSILHAVYLLYSVHSDCPRLYASIGN